MVVALLHVYLTVTTIWAQTETGSTEPSVGIKRNSCQNGGSFIDGLGCFCKAGYKGDDCGTGPECQDGWSLNGTLCYKFFDQGQSWSEANKICISENSRLVSIESNKTVAVLLNLAKNKTHTTSGVWIDEWFRHGSAGDHHCQKCSTNGSINVSVSNPCNVFNSNGSNICNGSNPNCTDASTSVSNTSNVSNSSGSNLNCTDTSISVSNTSNVSNSSGSNICNGSNPNCTDASISVSNTSSGSNICNGSNPNCTDTSISVPTNYTCPAVFLPTGMFFKYGCTEIRFFVCQRGLGCDALPPPDHGSTTLSANRSVWYGETVNFSCLGNRTLVGSTNRTCQLSGKWTGEETSCVDDDPDGEDVGKISFTAETYVSLSISLAGPILTAIAYMTFNDWLSSRHSKAVFISCLTVSATLVVFMANANNRGGENDCIATAVFLHFLWMFTSLWIAVEGFTIILGLRGIEETEMPKFVFRAIMTIFCTCAFIMLLTMELDFNSTYKRQTEHDACGPIGDGLRYAVITPVVIFLFVDGAIFVVALIYLLLNMKYLSSSQKQSNWIHVVSGILQTVLLGLTWVGMAVSASRNDDFSYGTRNDTQEKLEVTAPMLGIQIFVFHCILHGDVTRAFMKLVFSSHSSKVNGSSPPQEDWSTVMVNENTQKFEDTHTNSDYPGDLEMIPLDGIEIDGLDDEDSSPVSPVAFV